MGGIHEALGYQDPDHVFLGVRIRGRAHAAVPAEQSGNRCQIVVPGGDGNAEPPAAVVTAFCSGVRWSVVMSSTDGRDRMRPRPYRLLFSIIWHNVCILDT
jgi:hypothetical protein